MVKTLACATVNSTNGTALPVSNDNNNKQPQQQNKKEVETVIIWHWNDNLQAFQKYIRTYVRNWKKHLLTECQA